MELVLVIFYVDVIQLIANFVIGEMKEKNMIHNRTREWVSIIGDGWHLERRRVSINQTGIRDIGVKLQYFNQLTANATPVL